jgi:hypothetical protein
MASDNFNELNCEYMDSIDIHYIYIDLSNNIYKLITDKHIFDKCSDNNIITKELLMKYVQNKRVDSATGIRYKLKDILVYLVDIEPDKIKDFSKEKDLSSYSKFLKPLPILDNISLSPTIYMFHHINSMFILFQDPEITPHSILKQTINKKTTKKVRISPDISVMSSHDTNKTHKRLS